MTDIAATQKLLEDRLEFLEQRVQKLETSLRASHSQKFADQAVERESDEIKEELEKESVHEIALIKLALNRIESGEYGECASCGQEISAGRLKALPYTSKCITCESEAENAAR